MIELFKLLFQSAVRWEYIETISLQNKEQIIALELILLALEWFVEDHKLQEAFHNLKFLEDIDQIWTIELLLLTLDNRIP